MQASKLESLDKLVRRLRLMEDDVHTDQVAARNKLNWAIEEVILNGNFIDDYEHYRRKMDE